jgi:N-acetylmuramoyl-L-alanine amidase
VKTQLLRDITTIVLHHSASPRDTTSADEIREWHRTKGWDDIGYHYVVEGDGSLKMGRSIDMQPAAQSGHNAGTIAICVVGDNTKDGEGWTDSQRITAHSLIVMLRNVLGWRIPIAGHRDLGTTECPGVDVREVFKDLA